ncbi:pyrimidine reductase family protein [Nocardiopsis aegyptia]|uniref:Riboflavin biosynthesis pyrimidine reductase n=1 Tax=Nocardiopsis aegyptia TaxID=220378 RepID=A0A7Z0EJD1_9ACTN|nr:pyrimidine reductase family protein [Nocardiopsis aegyptia]NYJ33158.1 riboflavin biosynthesis pyrimidine reductase [Nocardiopsis aegyptia]
MVVRLLMNDVAPGAAEPGDPVDDSVLEALYAYPDTVGRPWVRANMVATLDGAAAGNDGRTGTINTEADLVVFTLLRDLADVVLVGAGTARAEGYRRPTPRTGARRARAEAQGRAAHPALAVVTRTAHVPPLLAAEETDRGQVWLLTCQEAGEPALERARAALGPERVLVLGEAEVDLVAAVDALHERGMSRILCEGGPRLLRDVAAEGVLDELCLTVVPVLAAGAEQRITAGAGVDQELVPRLLLEGGGTLLHRWIRP